MKVYIYAKCSTCRNALKWLDAHGFEYETRAIRETPPTEKELRAMLGHYDGALRRLFNTSSQDYRDAGLKDRLGAMSQREAFAVLRANGNLVKRPFLLAEGVGLVGFKPDAWAAALGV